MGEGFAAQAVIITCKDEEDEEENDEDRPELITAPKNIKSPLSFLAPIMKMLAAKAKARLENVKIESHSKPKIIVHPLSGSPPRPLESHMPMPFKEPPKMNIFNPGNPGPIRVPFKLPMPNFVEVNNVNRPLPNIMPNQVKGPFIDGQLVNRIINGPLPEIINNQLLNNQPIFRNTPISRIEERRPIQLRPFLRPIPFGPFQGPIQGPFPLPMNRPPVFNKINQPPHHMDEPHNHHQHENRPPHHHENGHLPHHHMNGPKPTFINERNEHPRNNRLIEITEKPKPIIGSAPRSFPFPLPKNVIPLKPITPEPIIEEKEGRTPKMIKLLPFNIRPLRLISPRRSRLLTPDAPHPIPPLPVKNEEIKPEFTPIPPPPPNFLPLARGVPLPSFEDETEEELPHPVPEASGRALPAPVNLPKIRLLPGRLLRLPLPACMYLRIKF